MTISQAGKQYQSHKIVRAFKIGNMVMPLDEFGFYLVPEGVQLDQYGVPLDKEACVFVSNEWIGRHKPQVGGYWVQFDDGYWSFSPADAFEKGHHEVGADEFDFGFAINALRFGNKVARQGWNGKGMWLELQTSTALSKMTLPYLYLNYPTGSIAYPEGARVPWLASQTDVLAKDWVVVNGN